MDKIAIRPARAGEAQALSALCFRSKAHWGYDAPLMAQSRASLTITPDLIATGRVLVAVDDRDVALGMASLAPLNDGTWDLLHMFVEPPAIGTGAGRLLFRAITQLALSLGAVRLSIQSDPNAEAFYVRMGARRVGEAPSDAIAGRLLPMLEYTLDDLSRS